ncbi:MAG: four helix bundle protein [Clostridia bacterium]|nr:MAG: four helix bundle protein [Clostridia bacterium]
MAKLLRPEWTSFEEWKQTVPSEIRDDTLWKVEAYRLALFASDIGWYDVTKLMQDKRTISLADQLYRSLGSESANIEEGYSKGTGKDRARFYEYALGSARESRGWYYRGRFILTQGVVAHRIGLQTHIIRLLLTMVPQQRGRTLRESGPSYTVPTSIDSLLISLPFA